MTCCIIHPTICDIYRHKYFHYLEFSVIIGKLFSCFTAEFQDCFGTCTCTGAYFINFIQKFVDDRSIHCRGLNAKGFLPKV